MEGIFTPMNPNFIHFRLLSFYRRSRKRKKKRIIQKFQQSGEHYRNENCNQSKLGSLLYHVHSLNLPTITADFENDIYCLKSLFLFNLYIKMHETIPPDSNCFFFCLYFGTKHSKVIFKRSYSKYKFSICFYVLKFSRY